jgi:hypothetical protein
MQRDAVQRLGDRIMKLPRKARPFGEGGGRLRLSIELGVLDSRGQLPGKGTDQAQIKLPVTAKAGVKETQDANRLFSDQ